MLRHSLTAMRLPVLVAVVSLLTWAAPVSAAMPDGAFGRFTLGGDNGGLVVVQYSGDTQVMGGILRLVANKEYRLRGSNAACSTVPTQANRVFRVLAMSDADGVLFLRRQVAINAVVRSFWLAPTDGSQPAKCANATNFDRLNAGNPATDLVLGIWDKEHVLSVVEQRPNNMARVSIVIDTGSGEDMVTLRAVNTACHTTPAHVYFHMTLSAVDIGAYESRLVSLTPAQLAAIRSFRVRGDTHTRCTNAADAMGA